MAQALQITAGEIVLTMCPEQGVNHVPGTDPLEKFVTIRVARSSVDSPIVSFAANLGMDDQ